MLIGGKFVSLCFESGAAFMFESGAFDCFSSGLFILIVISDGGIFSFELGAAP